MASLERRKPVKERDRCPSACDDLSLLLHSKKVTWVLWKPPLSSGRSHACFVEAKCSPWKPGEDWRFAVFSGLVLHSWGLHPRIDAQCSHVAHRRSYSRRVTRGYEIGFVAWTLWPMQTVPTPTRQRQGSLKLQTRLSTWETMPQNTAANLWMRLCADSVALLEAPGVLGMCQVGWFYHAIT